MGLRFELPQYPIFQISRLSHAYKFKCKSRILNTAGRHFANFKYAEGYDNIAY